LPLSVKSSGISENLFSIISLFFGYCNFVLINIVQQYIVRREKRQDFFMDLAGGARPKSDKSKKAPQVGLSSKLPSE